MKKPTTRKLTVNAIAESTGRDRRTVKSLLISAGCYPPEEFPRAKVLEAIKPADEDSSMNYKEKELYERWRKLRIKNDKDEGALVPRVNVLESLARRDVTVDRILEQKLGNEYPSAVAGLDVPQARIYGKRLADQIRVLFKETAKDFR